MLDDGKKAIKFEKISGEKERMHRCTIFPLTHHEDECLMEIAFSPFIYEWSPSRLIT